MEQVMGTDWPVLAAAIVALVAAGAVQGSVGFGFNMLSAPLLALIDPRFVPGPMLLLALLVCIGGAWRERGAIEARGLSFALTGRLLAAGPAVLCLGLLSEGTFSAVFGGVVLIAVALVAAGHTVARTPSTLLAAGAISGFMGSLTAIGAPPIAMVYQSAAGPVMRANLNAFFVVGGLISLAALWLVGEMGAHDLLLVAILTPFAALGFAVSGPLRPILDKGRTRMAVLVVSGLSGAVLFARGIAYALA
ncbi:MAG: sulfite exporter TauE/SafE family protein [Pseudomonadota bacterium]